jgi:hypothetical protein
MSPASCTTPPAREGYPSLQSTAFSPNQALYPADLGIKDEATPVRVLFEQLCLQLALQGASGDRLKPPLLFSDVSPWTPLRSPKLSWRECASPLWRAEGAVEGLMVSYP